MSTVAEAGPIRNVIRRAFFRSLLERASKNGTAAEKAAIAKALERGNRQMLNQFIDGLGDEFDENAAAVGTWQDFFKWVLENLPSIIAALLALFA